MASLTKEDLIEAHEQCLNVQTKGGTNFKIVANIMDVFAVQYSNSTKISWYGIDKINELQCSIEQPKVDLSILNTTDVFYLKTKKVAYVFTFDRKNDVNIYFRYQLHLTEPNNNYVLGIQIDCILELRLATESEIKLLFPNYKKYNGRAVKCDSVEQLNWLYLKLGKNNEFTDIELCNTIGLGENDSFCYAQYYAKLNYEIISFSKYCAENNIKEPIFIQGFEVKDGYNDVVMCSDDNINFTIDTLKEVRQDIFPFVCDHFNYKYCRLLKRSEINEIKFID
jgi:hypothetical protein